MTLMQPSLFSIGNSHESDLDNALTNTQMRCLLPPTFGNKNVDYTCPLRKPQSLLGGRSVVRQNGELQSLAG
jgi:hypothetical protein